MDYKQIIVSSLLIGAIGACAPTAEKNTGDALRLYVMDCGTIDVADISLFSPGVDQGKKKRLTDSCYLLVHQKGTLVWDTGLPDALAERAGGVTDGPFTVSRSKTLAAQLKEIGYTPAQIQYLGLSHMHFDHTGNANLFSGAKVFMQQEEFDAAFGPDAQKFRFNVESYSSLKDRVTKLNGDHDVFGDGSVVVKRAVGHTPGHQTLFVKLPQTGNILLSGDLVHFTDNWANKRVPSFNFDKTQSLQAMRDTEAFLRANNAQLWIQHDLEQNATIKHAPNFYR